MNYLLILFSASLLILSCSSNQNPNRAWDSGAQRQEAIEDETYNQNQERIRNQFPGQRSF